MDEIGRMGALGKCLDETTNHKMWCSTGPLDGERHNM